MGAFVTLAMLRIRRMLAPSRLLLALAILAVPVALSVALRARDLPLGGVFFSYYVMYPQSVCILLAILTIGTLFPAEVEDRTLTYVLTRPVPKAVIFWGQYAGAVVVVAALTVISMTASFFVLGRPGGMRFLYAFIGVGALAAAVYGAIFFAVGTIFPKRSLLLCVVYGVLEVILSFVPAVVNTWTTGYYLRGLSTTWAGIQFPPEFRFILPDSVPQSFLALGITVGVALSLAGALITFREYRMTVE